MEYPKRFLGLLLVLLLVACGRGPVGPAGPAAVPTVAELSAPTPAPVLPTAIPPTEAPPTEVPPTEAPPTEAPPTEVPPTEPPPPTEAPVAEEPLEAADIPELTVTTLDPTGHGLGHLGTFRQRMTVSCTAQESGLSGTYFYEAEVNTTDQAVHMTLRAEGPLAQEWAGLEVQVIWIGTRLWIKLGDQPWIPIPEEVSEARFEEQTFAVGDFLPFVPHFERVQPDETVNGVPSAHYAYTAENVQTKNGTVSGSGEIYVALEGGYVVRYTFDGSGTFEDLFQGSGEVHLTYDTYDVGAPIEIRPPLGR